MEPLCDVGQVKSHYGLLGDGVSVNARVVHGWHQMYHWLSNHFGRTHWYS
jgi:hypothetical protein